MKQTRPSSSPKSLFFGPFFFEGETVLYLLLSVADLLLTNFLLQQSRHDLEFIEANPVARYILHHWGPKGMVYFKFGMVAFVILVTQIIARYRPLTARLVLFFAIVIMGYVVVYSVRLYSAHAAAGAAPRDAAHDPSGRPSPLAIGVGRPLPVWASDPGNGMRAEMVPPGGRFGRFDAQP